MTYLLVWMLLWPPVSAFTRALRMKALGESYDDKAMQRQDMIDAGIYIIIAITIGVTHV